MDSTLLPFALLCFTSFFTLTNPLGTMPVFLTMTHGMTDKERQSIVQRATIVSFVTLMVFVFAGQFLFKFFGISTDGFRIAGGVIIFKIGFDMLQARYTPMKLKDEEIKTYADDISITPLGIPMLCGPGAIANAIVLMQDAHNFEMKGILIGTIGLIYLLTFFILRASTKLVSVLGETGNNASYGIDLNGDRSRMFRQWVETDIGGYSERRDGWCLKIRIVKNRVVEKLLTTRFFVVCR